MMRSRRRKHATRNGILCQNGKSLPAPAAQMSHVATAAQVSRLNGFEGQPSTLNSLSTVRLLFPLLS
jgi:hypothetical protein